VAVTVKVVLAIPTVGVPEIVPFELLKLSPAGRAGEIDQPIIAPPELLGTNVVIALPTVTLTELVGYKMFGVGEFTAIDIVKF
jgi:hypothetical protein